MAKNWQSIFLNDNRDEKISALYHAAIINNLAVAVWRHPKSTKKQVAIDLSGKCSEGIDFNRQNSGFWVAPFDFKKENSFFIHANYYFDSNELAFIGAAPQQDKSQILTNKSHFDKQFDQFINANLLQPSTHENASMWFSNPAQTSIQNINKPEYCSLIRKAISGIEDKKLRKVVVSRALEVELSTDFKPIELFNNLCDAYQNAFVSLVAIPGVGTWIGATPEVLLASKNEELITVALAGTRPLSPDDESWSKNWNEKEVVEQEIVSEFIRDCFSKEGITDYIEEKPESLRIGELLHLQTRFKIKKGINNGVNRAEKILNRLHPTPAVCGVPQNKAFEFIESEETHKREFYSGFLGPVNLQGESNLYVNLRCLQMQKNSAILYAGGGITIDSDVENEWHETELKLDALLKVINGKAREKVMRPKAVCYD